MLSGVANVFGVVSLAIQLAGTVQQLIEFWGPIKDAPIEIADIKARPKFLDRLLKEIFPRNYHETDLDRAVLQELRGSMKKLQLLSNEVERSLDGGGVQGF